MVKIGGQQIIVLDELIRTLDHVLYLFVYLSLAFLLLLLLFFHWFQSIYRKTHRQNIVIVKFQVNISYHSFAPSLIFVFIQEISVKDFRLDFDSLTNFETIFSNTYNLLILQASLTSRIQNDTLLVGSIINITVSSIANQTFNLNVISNTSCQVNRCLILFQQHSIDQLTNSKRIKLLFRYEQMISNGTKEYLSTPYYLPQTISTSNSIFSNWIQSKSFFQMRPL